MRPLLLGLLLAACAGPTQNTPSDTPTATTRRPPTLAPPASGPDKERSQLNQEFEGMSDAQQARREAKHTHAAPPAPPGTAPAAKPPVKRGPAEQAPPPPAAPTK